MNKIKYKYLKLGDITTTINGLWTGKKPPYIKVAVIRNTNFTKNCELDLTNIAEIDVEQRQYQSRKLYPGDIIVEKSGGTDNQPVGRAILFNTAEGDYSFSNFTTVFRIKDKSELLPEYLYRYLQAIYKKGVTKNMQSKTTGIHNLDLNAYKNILIPIPSIETQKNIIEELGLLNNLIQIMNQQIRDYDSLAFSTFYEMFGNPVQNERKWVSKNLAELSDKITNGNTPKGGSKVYVDEGIMFLRSQNVWRNRMELDDVAYIDEATHSKLSNSSVHHYDILITKTGRINTENSSLGRAALYTGEDNQANINGHVYLVRLKEGVVLHKFVLYILISEPYRELIRSVCVGGIDKRQLNRNHIEDFPIIVPPLELQEKYVTLIEAIEQQKDIINKSHQDLETLLSKRMQYWFE